MQTRKNPGLFGKGLTLSQLQILDSAKLKQFLDDNFTFDENGRKFTKWIENTVEKGEIACYEQFSFSHNVFKKLVLETHKNQGLFGTGLNTTLLVNITYKHVEFSHFLRLLSKFSVVNLFWELLS